MKQHKYEVGTICLSKDGQYECKIVQHLFDFPNDPCYLVKDLMDGQFFKELESYLIRKDDD